MSALNLRDMDPALHSALKSEAAAAGKGIAEYAMEILAARRPLPVTTSPAVSGRPSVLDIADVSTDPASGKALNQADPPVMGMWDDGPAKASGVVESGSGPGVLTMPKPKCMHGYMNRNICPQCRAS